MARDAGCDVSVAQLQAVLFDDMALDAQAPFFVALSGGMDSTVLLHLMVNLPEKLNITVLHLNHQLQTEADAWQQHCQTFCEQLNVPMLANRVDVAQLMQDSDRNPEHQGKGTEAVARQVRYTWFEQELEQTEKKAYLVTAHHLQDRVETLLFNLLRGAGSRGLSSMWPQRPLGQHDVVRPLLSFNRQQLLDYAKQHDLNWVEDPSNHNVAFSRNYIRQHIIPSLQKFRDDSLVNIARAANNLQADSAVLHDMAQQDLLSIAQQPYNPLDQSIALSIDDLTKLSESRQRNVLMHWFVESQLPFYSHDFIQSLIEGLREELPGSAIFQYKGYQIRCYGGFMYAMPALNDDVRLHSEQWIDREASYLISLYQMRLSAKPTLIDLCKQYQAAV